MSSLMSQVSRTLLWGCSLYVFAIVIVFVFLLVRSGCSSLGSDVSKGTSLSFEDVL